MINMSVNTHKGMGPNEHSWVLRRQCCHERAYLNAQPAFSMIFFFLISQLCHLYELLKTAEWQRNSYQMGRKLKGLPLERSLCGGRNLLFVELTGDSGRHLPALDGRYYPFIAVDQFLLLCELLQKFPLF